MFGYSSSKSLAIRSRNLQKICRNLPKSFRKRPQNHPKPLKIEVRTGLCFQSLLRPLFLFRLEVSWGVLGGSWGGLWSVLGTSCHVLGAVWGRIWRVLGRLGRVLGHHGAVLCVLEETLRKTTETLIVLASNKTLRNFKNKAPTAATARFSRF